MLLAVILIIICCIRGVSLSIEGFGGSIGSDLNNYVFAFAMHIVLFMVGLTCTILMLSYKLCISLHICGVICRFKNSFNVNYMSW